MGKGREQGAKGPRIVERYKGFDIWYDDARGFFYASHCEHSKRGRSTADVKRWIDREKR